MRRISSSFSLAHLLMVVAALTTFVTVAVVLKDSAATVEVVVASVDLQRGDSPGPAELDTVSVEAGNAVLSQMVTSEDDLTGLHLAHPIEAGQPILRNNLELVGASEGGRTFTLSADAYVVAGLGLTVGDRVDLVSSGIEPGFVAGGVEVVRLPQTDSLGGFAAASNTSWITVSVDEEQVLAIVESLANGEIQIVRSTGSASLKVEVGS